MKMPKWPIPYGNKDIKLGLERMHKLLSKLGNPHRKMPPIIHVAGTNGKGSTIAFLKYILESAGYVVHRYTSPHIVNFNERIELQGREITDAELDSYTYQCKAAADGLQATFFEATTAIAFLAFADKKADILLLETGMGGRLDATNVIDDPLLSIITPISMDHMEYLGDSIESIANEKAGIIKKNSSCVVSWQESSVKRLMLERCIQKNTVPFIHGISWDFSVQDENFIFITKNEDLTFPKPKLQGLHQILNAATAVAAVKMLTDFTISNDDVSTGILSTVWHARFEKITYKHVMDCCNDNAEVWVDGAHNISGAQFLMATIAKRADRKWIIINGRTANRDIKGYLQFFKGVVKDVYAVPVYSEPKGEDPQNIYNAACELGFDARVMDNLKAAICDISARFPEEKVGILICGSLYLAGDLANYFEGK